jgi:hypothetical protein
MAPKQSPQEAVRLTEGQDDQRQFIINPGDDDLFVRTGKQVIDACRLGISVEVWFHELSSMLQHVRQWTQNRKEAVRACFCVPRGTRVVLFFIPTSGQFNFDLADQLAKLNGELVKQFNVGMVEVGQIPWDELDRFLDPTKAKQIYGEQPGSHQAVEA